jgi:hypothetical protein
MKLVSGLRVVLGINVRGICEGGGGCKRYSKQSIGV